MRDGGWQGRRDRGAHWRSGRWRSRARRGARLGHRQRLSSWLGTSVRGPRGRRTEGRAWRVAGLCACQLERPHHDPMATSERKTGAYVRDVETTRLVQNERGWLWLADDPLQRLGLRPKSLLSAAQRGAERNGGGLIARWDVTGAGSELGTVRMCGSGERTIIGKTVRQASPATSSTTRRSSTAPSVPPRRAPNGPVPHTRKR